MENESELRGTGEDVESGAGQDTAGQGPAPSRTPYVRSRPAHKTVDPIDDYASEGAYEEAPGRAPSRRRGRSGANQLRRDLHYGQYLEIPKGRRDIFASRERKRRIKSAVALVVVMAVLVVVVLVLWKYMQTNWGATG